MVGSPVYLKLHQLDVSAKEIVGAVHCLTLFGQARVAADSARARDLVDEL